MQTTEGPPHLPLGRGSAVRPPVSGGRWAVAVGVCGEGPAGRGRSDGRAQEMWGLPISRAPLFSPLAAPSAQGLLVGSPSQGAWRAGSAQMREPGAGCPALSVRRWEPCPEGIRRQALSVG